MLKDTFDVAIDLSRSDRFERQERRQSEEALLCFSNQLAPSEIGVGLRCGKKTGCNRSGQAFYSSERRPFHQLDQFVFAQCAQKPHQLGSVRYSRREVKGTPPKTLKDVAAARNKALNWGCCIACSTKSPSDDIRQQGAGQKLPDAAFSRLRRRHAHLTCKYDRGLGIEVCGLLLTCRIRITGSPRQDKEVDAKLA